MAQAFEAFPPRARRKLMAMRELIFKTAAATPGVGELEETLKWGEPAYLTPQSKSGSTLRIGWNKKRPSQVALYVNCQTNLVDNFKTMFPNDFSFEGSRALVFDEAGVLPNDALAWCIAATLTYHAHKH